MKLYAFYFSPTGGTKKVLDIICSAWDCQTEWMDLSDLPKTGFPVSFRETDLYIVAVPSFSGRVPQFIVPILQRLQGNQAKAILISTYGNRAFDDTLLELKDTMEQAGFLCYCAAVTRHSVMPRYGAGRPGAEDKKELKRFAVQCRELLKQPFTPIGVPGSRPYRTYGSIPVKPRADKCCMDCGLCYQKCPVHAIPGDHYRTCDANVCISCLQCITVCPQKARHVNRFILKAAEITMRKTCSGRKPNQFGPYVLQNCRALIMTLSKNYPAAF